MFGAGGAGAGVGDYASPLYVSKVASPALTGAHELVTNPGSSTPTSSPTTTAAAGLGIPTGFYRYSYTVVDANGSETEPSPVSLPDVQTTTGMQNVLVGGLPTGVTVRLYRRKSSTILSYRVAELVNNASATYTDSAGEPPAGAVVLPQAQNRVAWVFMNPYSCTASNCGYEEFRPGIPVPNASTSFPVSPPPASPTPNGSGWVVEDATGNVAFAGGDWTFRVKVKSGPMTTGTAHLVVGMWKVTASGPSYSLPLIDPTGLGEETATNLIDTSNSFRAITHTVSVPAFTLAPGEQLYVQLWRRQTAPYQSASANDARVLTLAAQDGYSRISHPGVSTIPDVPGLDSPADGSYEAPGTPELRGVFTDPDAGDGGTLEFRVCSTLTGGAGSDCADVVATGSSASVANGATAAWTVAPTLTVGTYYWQARAHDAIGTSGWSPTRSFVVHGIPDVPDLLNPADGVYMLSTSPTLDASYSDAGGDSGNVDFRVCSTSAPAGTACSGAVATGSSAALASGETGSWTIDSALAPGTYYWQARAQDAHSAQSDWSTTVSFTVHRAPDTPALVAPGEGVFTTGPTLEASFTDADGDSGTLDFRVCSAGAAAGAACPGLVATGSSAVVASGATGTWAVDPALAAGTYHWQARAQDSHAAQSDWSATMSFTVHRAPDTPTLTTPADGFATLSATPTLDAYYSDADGDSGTLDFRVCSASAPAGTACSGAVATGSSGALASGSTGSWTVSPALTPGTYHWQARAEDSHDAQSDWSATRSFTVHRAPSTPTLVSPAAGAQVRTDTPLLKASFSDPDGDDGAVKFRVCREPSPAGQACTKSVAAGWSATVASGTTATWAVAPPLADGSYYWQARAQDENGVLSGWTATRRLNVAKHLIRILSAVRFECSVGARLPVRFKLAARASITVLFHLGGHVDLVHDFGKFDAGNTTLRKFLAYDLARPARYWVEWRAARTGERESAWMRVDVKPLPSNGIPYCRSV